MRKEVQNEEGENNWIRERRKRRRTAKRASILADMPGTGRHFVDERSADVVVPDEALAGRKQGSSNGMPQAAASASHSQQYESFLALQVPRMINQIYCQYDCHIGVGRYNFYTKDPRRNEGKSVNELECEDDRSPLCIFWRVRITFSMWVWIFLASSFSI
jgi:hypothetical protein